MTGQGGWPLTGFLTPDGDVFYGGTYFPPDSRFGRPGFRTVLEQVLRFWKEDRSSALDHAGAIRRAIAERAAGTAPGSVSAASLLAAERRMLGFFDPVFAGFGSAPKFPHPGGIRVLLDRWADGGSSDTLHAARETLRAMARGGIHDQLGGGFHRYSVDRQWAIPHFEKMSYDNSELLRAYLDAAALLDDDEFRSAARGIVRWVRTELALPDGGYGTSQDADIGPDDDGSYFTWTRDEMAAVLTPSELELAVRRFGLGTTGEMPHSRAQCSSSFPPADNGGTRGVGDQSCSSATTKLSVAREKRARPFVDRTPYTSWNAMMAGAMLRAAAVLQDDWAREHALDPALRRSRSVGPSATRRRRPAGRPIFGAGALDAFSRGLAWLDWSVAVMDATWEWHVDPDGGLRDVAHDRAGAGLLDVGQTPIEDSPTPSPNGVAGVVCARLFAHTADPRWNERSRSLVEAFAGVAPGLGLHGAAWCLAADWILNTPTHLVVTGAAGDRSRIDAPRRARGRGLDGSSGACFPPPRPGRFRGTARAG
jgi:uncharacterized protein YyaL (SSP411 family)